MEIFKSLLLLAALLLIFGCAQAKDFRYGLGKISSLNSKYNTTIDTYPKSIAQINSMLEDYRQLKNIQLDSGQESFAYVADYRILNLEAEKLYIESQKYGGSGTTKEGFGCRSRPFIIESVSLRNKSSLKAFEAVSLIREFIDKHPEDAGLSGLSAKTALFLNATFYQVSRDARTDSNVINHFCPMNVTLDVYRQNFRKKTNLSEESISKMSYEEAVQVWKKLNGMG